MLKASKVALVLVVPFFFFSDLYMLFVPPIKKRKNFFLSCFMSYLLAFLRSALYDFPGFIH